jgi:hypothetical protein
VFSSVPISRRHFFRELAGNHFESACYFIEQNRELNLEHRFLGVDHYIDRPLQNRTTLPDGVPHPALDAIPLNSSPKYSSNRESGPGDTLGDTLIASAFRLPQIKYCDVSGKVSATLFVDAFEVGVFQQPGRTGESCSAAALVWLYTLVSTPVRSAGVH